MPVKRIGVLGAGVMGGGIAQLAADRGLSVRMKDIQEDALGKGLAEANRLFQAKVKRRRLKKNEAQFRMDRISPTLTYDGLQTLDVVIEAVVEKLPVKRMVLKEVEERAAGKVIFATNTSSLPITDIAAECKRPDQVVGMHFFNPVNRMPLVEIIRGKKTSDEAVATVFALAKAMGKVPVSCEDGPGFLVNRLLMPYMNEAAYLLLEGVPVEVVDKAMVSFGMPMGPVRLMDEVGLDVAYHVGTFLESKFPERMKGAPLLKAISETDLLGKKGGAGFYLYDEKGKETAVNSRALALLPPPKTAPPECGPPGAHGPPHDQRGQPHPRRGHRQNRRGCGSGHDHGHGVPALPRGTHEVRRLHRLREPGRAIGRARAVGGLALRPLAADPGPRQEQHPLLHRFRKQGGLT